MDELVLYIAKKAGMGDLKTSTRKISLDIAASQQTISRNLRELEKQGIIYRTSTPNGVTVKLTTTALLNLRKEFLVLKGIFGNSNQLQGEVMSGVAEGKYYITVYSKKFEEKLGFIPYPGTLNINVDSREKSLFLSGLQRLEIMEFKTKTRSFGAVYCYAVNIKIKETIIKGAIVVPVRARHPDNIIELVAAYPLRKKFNLKDSDKLIVLAPSQ